MSLRDFAVLLRGQDNKSAELSGTLRRRNSHDIFNLRTNSHHQKIGATRKKTGAARPGSEGFWIKPYCRLLRPNCSLTHASQASEGGP